MVERSRRTFAKLMMSPTFCRESSCLKHAIAKIESLQEKKRKTNVRKFDVNLSLLTQVTARENSTKKAPPLLIVSGASHRAIIDHHILKDECTTMIVWSSNWKELENLHTDDDVIDQPFVGRRGLQFTTVGCCLARHKILNFLQEICHLSDSHCSRHC